MNKVIATSIKYFFKSKMVHCIKSARIRSYSGPHFPAFGLNKKRYSVSLPMRKNADQRTLNTDTFYAVVILHSDKQKS